MSLDYSLIDELLKAKEENTALIGFRSWGIDYPKLTSIGLGDTAWDPEMAAVCKASQENREEHAAPGTQCECGLYAYHNPSVIKEEEISKLYKSICSNETSYSCYGVVLGSGKVQIQKDGWRAEKVQIAALLKSNNPDVEKWARKHNIPLINYWDIEDFTDMLKEKGCSSLEKSFTKHLPVNSKTRRNGDLLDSSVEPSLVIDDTSYWFRKGLLHREDGPAIEQKGGEKIWCKRGKVFREEDKPAIEGSTNKFWASLIGEAYNKRSEELFDIWFEDRQVHRTEKPAVISKTGIKKWFRQGNIHRDDGYAVEYPDGTQLWYQQGLLHRDDGPAEIKTGKHFNESWYKNGELHRIGGPARITPQGKFWHINGEIHRDDDLPAAIYENGTQVWWHKGEIHRENGPAMICDDGTKKWFCHHKLDREDGPAVERPDGKAEYWIKGAKQDEDSPCKPVALAATPPFDMSIQARKILMRINPDYIKEEMNYWENS